MDNEKYFGQFIREKRIAKHITILEVTSELGISNPYWCDIEKGRRRPPDLEKLEKLAKMLELTYDERSTMMDLAGMYSDQAAEDITGYILTVPGISTALRIAKDNNVTGEEWQEMIKEMISRHNLK